MDRCLACNGILKPGEKVCYACGDGVPPPVASTPWSKRVSLTITLMFFGAVGMTGWSFFSDRAPRTSICLASAVILMFVKRSADQLLEKKS